MSEDLFTKHKSVLESAISAAENRGHWSQYPETPSGKIYGATAAQDGEAAFKALLGKPIKMKHAASDYHLTGETSPFGLELGISYPKADPDQLLPAMAGAMKAWRKAGAARRAGICLEILERLNKHSFNMAHAVQHTTGQGFMMAFQAGGPHAQDRGLEAVTYGYLAQRDVPESAIWEKPLGKDRFARLEKRWDHGRTRYFLIGGLRHLPHLERLSGIICLAGNRQSRAGETASGGGIAAGNQC